MVEAGTRRSIDKIMHCFCGIIHHWDSQRLPEEDSWTENKDCDFFHVRNSHQAKKNADSP